MLNGLPLTDLEQLQLTLKWGGLEAWGTEMMYPHYSSAWAWASNTPFRWGKQIASHLGGTRNPMVVRCPQRITDSGGLRSQFTHVSDIGPTILDMVGIPQPTHVDGIEQQPMTGASFADSLADAGRLRAPYPAVLRELRQPGDVQGRLVAVDADAAHPVAAGSRGAQAVRARRLEARRGPGRAVLPAR